MNKIEQVSSGGHQMSLAGDMVGGSIGFMLAARGDPLVPFLGGGHYSDVQCIMGDDHVGHPGQNDRQTWLKT